MAHLIDKSAVVAEIERLENKLYYEPENFKDVGAKMALDSLKSSLDTLEVKEVNDEPECKIFPRPIECYSTCKECPWLATNKAQKGKQL